MRQAFYILEFKSSLPKLIIESCLFDSKERILELLVLEEILLWSFIMTYGIL